MTKSFILVATTSMFPEAIENFKSLAESSLNDANPLKN